MIMLDRLIKKLSYRIGWGIRRLTVSSDASCQLVQILNSLEIDLVFDIGANQGQFAQDLRAAGYKGEIVSFEPLKDAHAMLTRAARFDSRWRVHDRVAIGDFDGEVSLNVSGNSVSSSVLPMLAKHSDAAAGSEYVGVESVRIVRLDEAAPSYLASGRRYFLKIDTQGFEWQVLDGAIETLRSARGVICEMSLLPLYEGQRLWRDMIDRLAGLGFGLWAIQRGFTDPGSGRSLQVDGIFGREIAGGRGD